MAKKELAGAGLTALKADLQRKNPAQCYVFYGPEAFLKYHYLRLLKKLLLDDLTEQFNYHRLTPETFSLQTLLDSVEAFPMMAERSLVQVDDWDLFKLGESDREQVIGLLGDLPEHVCLVLFYDAAEFKPDKRQKKLWQALSSHGVLVDFQKPSERELCDWVGRQFLKEKKQIGPELCRYLLVRTGGDMSLMKGEISKLCAYASGPAITRGDIDAVVEPVLEAVVFDISNAIAAGNFPVALEKLQTLFQKQEEPIPILAAIGSQMRRLHAARLLRSRGRAEESLKRLYGLGEYPAKLTVRQANQLSDRFCQRAVLLCLQTDEQLKTSYDDPKRLLELLVVRLAQEARA